LPKNSLISNLQTPCHKTIRIKMTYLNFVAHITTHLTCWQTKWKQETSADYWNYPRLPLSKSCKSKNNSSRKRLRFSTFWNYYLLEKKYAYRLKLEARLATYQDGLSLKTNFQLRNPPLEGHFRKFSFKATFLGVAWSQKIFNFGSDLQKKMPNHSPD